MRDDATFRQIAAAAAAEPVAIVGLGAVLPGARNAAEFWDNCLAGRVALRAPHAAAQPATVRAPIGDRPTLLDAGYLLDEWTVDWRRFRLPPAETASINPLQFATLEAGMETLAGVRHLPRATTAVILGATGLGFQKDSGLRVRLDDMLEALRSSPAFQALPPAQREAVLAATTAALDARLKPSSNDNSVGSLASVAAARISNHFDLCGPHYTVDADHASALAALELAVLGLRSGEWDCVITGGVSELIAPAELLAYERMGLLSPSGRVAPFDAHADGMLLGEGVALLTLKRLGDARRDGDPIYALVEGIGIAGPGEPSRGPRRPGEAPSPAAFEAAIRAAHAQAAIDPVSIDAVECDAPGIADADEAEALALGAVFNRRERPLWLGSSKANVGHLRAAAGAAGLVRTALALHHRKLPPQPGASAPALWLAPAGFVLPSQPMAWPTSHQPGLPPRAGVTAASLAGQCFHAVIAGLATDAASGATVVPLSAARPEATPRPAPALAITGMGGVYSGADSLGGFFQDLLDGKDQVREVPASRWRLDTYCSDEPERREKSYARRGSFIELPEPREGEVDAAEQAAVNPTHLALLRAADQALADAGGPRWDPERVRTFVAFMPFQARKFVAEARANYREFAAALEGALHEHGLADEESERIVVEAEGAFKAPLAPLDGHSLLGWLGGMGAVRIARRFGFRGASTGIESACASMLAALHAAAESLGQGLCDVAIVAGGWVDIAPEFYVATCRFNGLSPAGIAPFGAEARGFVPGEGAGVFVLRRLEDAEREGERIRAVLRAVAGSSDGKGRSVLTPSIEGESLAIQRALAGAGVDPLAVDYVECHGTGTPLGDATEAMALACAYGATPRPTPLLVGSVKSNLGHLIAAAGAPALSKIVLALEQQLLPPSLHCDAANPKIGFSAAGLELVRKPAPWAVHADGTPRRAGLSAFGIGGSNFHAVIEEYQRVAPAAAALPRRLTAPQLLLPDGLPAQLFTFAAASAEECAAELGRAAQALQGASAAELAQAARASRVLATQAADAAPWRLALVVEGADELERHGQRLHEVLRGERPANLLAAAGLFLAAPQPAAERGRLALTFSGYGSHYAGMLAELATSFPAVADALTRADVCWQSLTGRPLRAALWPPTDADFAPSPEEAHVAVVVVGYALHQLLARFGIRAELMIGQSAGELAALCAAGALSFEEAIGAMYERTRAVNELPGNGFMAVASCSAVELRRILKGLRARVVIAGENSPAYSVVSGEREALERVSARCSEAGKEITPLALTHAYHSPLIAGAARRYREALDTVSWQTPALPVLSTVDLAVYDESRTTTIERLVRQFTSPVRLREAIDAAYERGARLYFEAGAKWPLTSYVRETLGERPHLAHASIHPKVGEATQLLRLLACAFVNGVGQLDGDEVVAGESLSAAVPATRMATASAPAAEGQGSEATALDAPQAEPAAAETTGAERADTPVAAPAAASEIFERVRELVVSSMSERTGYPADMLELDLDLEGDLGIDTVKQVEVLARVREQLGLTREPGLSMRELSTLRKAIERFVHRLGGVAPQAATPAPAPRAPHSAAPMAPVHAGPTPTSDRSAQLFERVTGMLVRAMAERTGYPADMLELDLDLEGDLGIDTVKQVEVLGRVREELGLVREPGLSMRELCTLRKAAERFVRRLEPAATTAPIVASAPAPEVAPIIALRSTSRGGEKQAPPHASSLALPPSATVAHLAAGEVRLERTFSRADQPMLDEHHISGAACVPAGLLLEALSEAAARILGKPARAASQLHLPQLVRLGPDGRARVRVEARRVAPGRVRAEIHGAGDGSVLTTVELLAEPEALIADSELSRARARLVASTRPLEADGAELIEAGDLTLWARPLSFCELVGGIAPRLDGPPAPGSALLPAALIEGAAALVGFAWFALVGRAGSTASVESILVARQPLAGEALSCHVRLRHASSAAATADVLLLGADRTPVARFGSLRVAPVAAVGGAATTRTDGGALADFYSALRERSAVGRG